MKNFKRIVSLVGITLSCITMAAPQGGTPGPVTAQETASGPEGKLIERWVGWGSPEFYKAEFEKLSPEIKALYQKLVAKTNEGRQNSKEQAEVLRPLNNRLNAISKEISQKQRDFFEKNTELKTLGQQIDAKIKIVDEKLQLKGYVGSGTREEENKFSQERENLEKELGLDTLQKDYDAKRAITRKEIEKQIQPLRQQERTFSTQINEKHTAFETKIISLSKEIEPLQEQLLTAIYNTPKYKPEVEALAKENVLGGWGSRDIGKKELLLIGINEQWIPFLNNALQNSFKNIHNQITQKGKELETKETANYKKHLLVVDQIENKVREEIRKIDPVLADKMTQFAKIQKEPSKPSDETVLKALAAEIIPLRAKMTETDAYKKTIKPLEEQVWKDQQTAWEKTNDEFAQDPEVAKLIDENNALISQIRTLLGQSEIVIYEDRGVLAPIAPAPTSKAQ